MKVSMKTACVSAILLALVFFGVKLVDVAAATAYFPESDRPFNDPNLVRDGDRTRMLDNHASPSSFEFQQQRTADEGYFEGHEDGSFDREDQSSSIRDQVIDVLDEIFTAPFDLYSVVLFDGDFGWEPDGNRTTFVIDDFLASLGDLHPSHSTVLINTIQENYVVCAVDYLFSDGYFEVNCNEPPADGAKLKYVVINQEPIVPAPVGNETERFENVSAGDIDRQANLD